MHCLLPLHHRVLINSEHDTVLGHAYVLLLRILLLTGITQSFLSLPLSLSLSLPLLTPLRSSTTETSAYQTTRNPRNLQHAPGGSSGGSAAAVAAGSVLGSLGTDTGGSIRQPAAWCGIVGLKPSWGRVSRSGLIAYASSLDCVGPLATSVADCALLLSAIAGRDAGVYYLLFTSCQRIALI
jgi:Amidase